MAEAAVLGWMTDAETHYNAGVKASLDQYGVGAGADAIWQKMVLSLTHLLQCNKLVIKDGSLYLELGMRLGQNGEELDIQF